MKTKYQIFVSSTFEDLKVERDIAIKAILEMGHIPVGMEMFSAGDEEQWELIKRQIDDSDYYVLIIAHRYGSMDGDISYTEKEYEYAATLKVPILGFVLDKDAPWPASKMDTDGVKKEALEKFKAKALKKIISKWKSSQELHALISISLSKAITAYPRPGWVRSTNILTPDVVSELGRLSKENARLRETNNQNHSELHKELHDAEESRKIITLLKKNKKILFLKLENKESEWSKGPNVSLYTIFELIAPIAYAEASIASMSKLLAVSAAANKKMVLSKSTQWPVPKNLIGELLATFRALRLVEPSKRRHAVQDKEEYWTLTEKGERIHSAALIAQLEKDAANGVTIEPTSNELLLNQESKE